MSYADQCASQERGASLGDLYKRLIAIVREQANDDGLWSIPLDRQQTIYEAHLQKALRRLHAEIEGEKWAKEFYK